MAEYRGQYTEIRNAGGDVAGVSVDEPAKSESLRQELKLPFTLLCDTQKTVITKWGVLNEKERGGIATPSVFVVDGDLRVRFGSVDRMGARIRASAIVDFLREGMQPEPVTSRRRVIPHPIDWLRAIRNHSH
ncbi:MAG: peroxiredoxin family protein [Acidobacteriota bacterium]|nr:peroxiredoxin family protein [Acidobacteriota bacterium]